ncbi:MAG TPA: hydroxymethylbilane synthase, partial [Desulfobaccales bacterium]
GLDALILAAAGLNRLGLSRVYRGLLSEDEMLPAVAQGALGLEGRAADQRIREAIAFLDHPPSRIAVTAERAFLARLEGGCMVPVAALGRVEGDSLTLEALISDLEGRRYLRDRSSGHLDDARFLGTDLANRLLDLGGREILAELCAQPL